MKKHHWKYECGMSRESTPYVYLGYFTDKETLKDRLIESFADWLKSTLEASTPGWPISNSNTQLLDATTAYLVINFTIAHAERR